MILNGFNFASNSFDKNDKILNISKKEWKTSTRNLWKTVKKLLSEDVVVNFNYLTKKERRRIKRRIRFENERQFIQNGDIFGPITDDTIILLIQVDNRLSHLKILIESLKVVKDIDKSLLIFSHSFFSNEIYSFVKRIKFCPVMQIFFPYTLQVHPHDFPGRSKNDCSDGNYKTEESGNCVGSKDKFGKYRDPNLVQIKHHWWWKANQVFDHLLVTKNYNGYVVFLEEDYFVSPDLMLVIRAMTLGNLCPHCNIYSLGKF